MFVLIDTKQSFLEDRSVLKQSFFQIISYGEISPSVRSKPHKCLQEQ